MDQEFSEYVSSDDFYNREDFMYFQEESRGEAMTEAEVTNVLNLLPTSRPLRILDTPCGFGRHSAAFASHGHDVTGLDRSEVFLEEARKRASGHRVMFLCEDLDTVVGIETFDLVANLFNSFGYFDHWRNLRFLDRCQSQLKVGGALVIDTINGLNLQRSGFLDPVVLRRQDNWLRITKVLEIDDDPGDNVVYTMSSSLRGRRCHTNFSIRFYSPSLLETMLLRNGFSTVRSYNTLMDMVPLAEHSKYMVLVAIK